METSDETELLQCPYQPSHRIMKSRFQVHLGRCRRNHKDVPKVTCPFNVCHILNEPELNWHLAMCPERSSFEKFRHVDQGVSNTPENAVNPIPQQLEATSRDDWDRPNRPTYNPQAYASTAPILRQLQGVSPSQKKQFRKQERLRLLGIEDKNEN